MQRLVWVSLLDADQITDPQQTLAAAWDKAPPPESKSACQRQGSLSGVAHPHQPAVLVKAEPALMQQEASTGMQPCGQPQSCGTGAVAPGGTHDITTRHSVGQGATPAGASRSGLPCLAQMDTAVGRPSPASGSRRRLPPSLWEGTPHKASPPGSTDLVLQQRMAGFCSPARTGSSSGNSSRGSPQPSMPAVPAPQPPAYERASGGEAQLGSAHPAGAGQQPEGPVQRQRRFSPPASTAHGSGPGSPSARPAHTKQPHSAEPEGKENVPVLAETPQEATGNPHTSAVLQQPAAATVEAGMPAAASDALPGTVIGCLTKSTVQQWVRHDLQAFVEHVRATGEHEVGPQMHRVHNKPLQPCHGWQALGVPARSRGSTVCSCQCALGCIMQAQGGPMDAGQYCRPLALVEPAAAFSGAHRMALLPRVLFSRVAHFTCGAVLSAALHESPCPGQPCASAPQSRLTCSAGR